MLVLKNYVRKPKAFIFITPKNESFKHNKFKHSKLLVGNSRNIKGVFL